MKNAYTLIGFIAIAAIISFSLSCKQEEEKDISPISAPNISSAPALPSGVTAFTNDAAGREAALDLFDKLSYTLTGDLGDAFDEVANKIATSGTPATPPLPTATSSSSTVTVPKTSYDKITGLTLSGKRTTSVSLSGGMTYADYISKYQQADWENGWSRTRKRSGSAEFNFQEFKAANYQNIKAAGVIKVSGKSEGTDGVKDKVNKIYTEKYVNETKYAFALTIHDGTKGAKYRFSYASNGSGNTRKVSGKNFEEISTLQVYDGANNLLFEFNDVGYADGLYSLAQAIYY
jgi:hypothetical protein